MHGSILVAGPRQRNREVVRFSIQLFKIHTLEKAEEQLMRDKSISENSSQEKIMARETAFFSLFFSLSHLFKIHSVGLLLNRICNMCGG